MGIMMLAAAKGTILKFEAAETGVSEPKGDDRAFRIQVPRRMTTTRRFGSLFRLRNQIRNSFLVEILQALIDFRKSLHDPNAIKRSRASLR